MDSMRSEEENTRMDSTQSKEADIFEEKCCSLYSLILDQLNDDLGKDTADSCRTLEVMAAEVMESGKKLSIDSPDLEGGVQLRIHTISSAMEQLRLRRTTSDCDSIGSRSAPFTEIRAWIHSVEERLTEHETAFSRNMDTGSITKLLADQQVLQLEIQAEGQSYISRLDNYVSRSSSARRQHCVEGIRKRWHTVYLNSLSLQCRIEDRRARLAEESTAESDPELGGPPVKRRKRREGEEDEERICDSEMDDTRTTTATSGSMDEGNECEVTGSSGQEAADVGYSSGEGSAHERLSPSSEQIENEGVSLLRRVRKATVLPNMALFPSPHNDSSDVDLFKNSFTDNLTDSLIVNHDSPMKNSPEYEEVLALLEEDDGVFNRVVGTQWREMRGGRTSPRRRKESGDDKQSCDASSEDSSEWEGPTSVNGQDPLLSSSMHSAFSADLFSLKRQRGSNGRLNVSMLASTMSSEMDASFCSTRSELPGGKYRGLRKKCRPRRLPRSMSDGEQLSATMAAGNATLCPTPFVRLSPPRTPLTSSISLLKRLEDDLSTEENGRITPRGRETGRRNNGEVSGGEESAAYEWDDYHPPAKDESWLPDELSTLNPPSQGTPTKMDVSASDLLSVDEDFSRELGNKTSLHRLVEESRANLAVVRSHLECADIEDSAMRTVTLIANTNIRHLHEALRTVLPHHITELRELEEVMSEWKRVASPLPRIALKVRHFAHSLRSLGQETSLPSGGIHTKEQARLALETLEGIEGRFRAERDELRHLLSSSSVQKELSGMENEFTALATGYDDAISKISSLVKAMRKLDEDWGSMAEQQRAMRELMQSLEIRLKEGNVDQPAVMREMELCQERMDSLETTCNYLSSHLSQLQEGPSGDSSSSSSMTSSTHSTPEHRGKTDFSSEILLYANALDQLKRRVNEALHIPPVPECPSIEVMDHEMRQRRVATTQTVISPVIQQRKGFIKRVADTVKQSRTVQLLLLLSALCALAAILSSGVLNTSFGPHLEYVRGPPPV